MNVARASAATNTASAPPTTARPWRWLVRPRGLKRSRVRRAQAPALSGRYPADLDRHCVACHGPSDPDGGLDLTGEMTTLFCRSYENMIQRDLVGYIQEFVGPKPEGADAMGYAPAVPPYTYGSHNSRLMAILRQGHYDVQLSREEFVRLATWVDGNAPYYGSYFGRRNLAFRDDPDSGSHPRSRQRWGSVPSIALSSRLKLAAPDLLWQAYDEWGKTSTVTEVVSLRTFGDPPPTAHESGYHFSYPLTRLRQTRSFARGGVSKQSTILRLSDGGNRDIMPHKSQSFSWGRAL